MTCRNNTNKKASKQNLMVIYAKLQNALTHFHLFCLGTWYLMRKQASLFIPSTLWTTISSHECNTEKLHFFLKLSLHKSFLKMVLLPGHQTKHWDPWMYFQPKWPERQKGMGFSLNTNCLNCFKFPKFLYQIKLQFYKSNQNCIFEVLESTKKEVLNKISYASKYLNSYDQQFQNHAWLSLRP